MRPLQRYQVQWAAGGKEQTYILPAASAEDARKAFNAYRVGGVGILRISKLEDEADHAVGVSSPAPVEPKQPVANNAQKLPASAARPQP